MTRNSKIVQILFLNFCIIIPYLILNIYDFINGKQFHDEVDFTLPSLLFGIAWNITLIGLVYYFLNKRGDSFYSLGIKTPSINDFFAGIGIFIVVLFIGGTLIGIASRYITFEKTSFLYTNIFKSEYLYIIIFFLFTSIVMREIITRGFTMTTIFNINHNIVVAVIASILCDFLLYVPLYGFKNALLTLPTAIIFSLFYFRWGNLNRIIIAHILIVSYSIFQQVLYIQNSMNIF